MVSSYAVLVVLIRISFQRTNIDFTILCASTRDRSLHKGYEWQIFADNLKGDIIIMSPFKLLVI